MLNRLHDFFLSEQSKNRVERAVLGIALVAFLVHLLLIVAVDSGLIWTGTESSLLTDPVAAIYTPFSFILVYEVYLLVFYLPSSITVYVGKQYEIITLIIIRRLFKDLANIELSSEWFQIKSDLIFTADLIASLTLFLLIYLFGRLGSVRIAEMRLIDSEQARDATLHRFIGFKRTVATCLVPILAGMAFYSFFNWASLAITDTGDPSKKFKNINNIFFEDFFTALIIVDVILLLISFFNTDQFHKIIRNSGFVISTILIRQSFTIEGPISSMLIVVAVVFGLGVLLVHNLFETLANRDESLRDEEPIRKTH